jgi:hypothetical protein
MHRPPEQESHCRRGEAKQNPYKQGWGRGEASKRRAAGLKSNAFTPYRHRAQAKQANIMQSSNRTIPFSIRPGSTGTATVTRRPALPCLTVEPRSRTGSSPRAAARRACREISDPPSPARSSATSSEREGGREGGRAGAPEALDGLRVGEMIRRER